MNKNPFKISLIWLLGWLISGHAFAGPPFITDDPEPVEINHWEVNYAFNKTWREGGSSIAMPSVDINYGLGSDFQLHVQPKYAYVASDKDKSFGIDNTEIGFKYRFINQQYRTRNWMVGIYPIIQLPTGVNRLGDGRGKVQTFLPLWVQCNSDAWTIYGGLGYRMNQYVDSKNSWFSGIAAMYRFSNQLQFGGEAYQESAGSFGEHGQSGFNLGGVYNITENYHVLFSAGKGLSNVNDTNRFSTYLALQVIY